MVTVPETLSLYSFYVCLRDDTVSNLRECGAFLPKMLSARSSNSGNGKVTFSMRLNLLQEKKNYRF